AAVSAKWTKVSLRTISRRGRYISGSNPVTSAAICEGSPAASNFVMRRTPLTPSMSCFQKASTPIPIGETTPRPVTTTRLIEGSMTLQSGCTLRRPRELAPPELQDPDPCQETLDERGVEHTIACQFDP